MLRHEPEPIVLLRETLRRFVAAEMPARDLLGMPIVGGSSNMQKNDLAKLWGLAE
jgi:hypothetical protein